MAAAGGDARGVRSPAGKSAAQCLRAEKALTQFSDRRLRGCGACARKRPFAAAPRGCSASPLRGVPGACTPGLRGTHAGLETTIPRVRSPRVCKHSLSPKDASQEAETASRTAFVGCAVFIALILGRVSSRGAILSRSFGCFADDGFRRCWPLCAIVCARTRALWCAPGVTRIGRVTGTRGRAWTSKKMGRQRGWCLIDARGS